MIQQKKNNVHCYDDYKPPYPKNLTKKYSKNSRRVGI